MAVDSAAITTLYNTYMTDHKAILDAEFDSKRMQSDMYAKALISMMQASMQLATTTVQQQPVLDNQVLKTIADTAFVETQNTELSNSVTYNNKIKALDSYSDMIGTMGAGSLVISTDMFTTFFEMVAGLNADASTPADTTVTKL